MTRDEAKKILGENSTEEQVTNLLNSIHNMEKAKNDEIASLKANNSKYSDYDEIKSKLDAIEKANMTEQEKLEEMKKETLKNLKEAKLTNNLAKAREILAGENINEELLLKLIDEDSNKTIQMATLFKQTISNERDLSAKKTKEDLSKISLEPTISNVKQNDDAMTFDKFCNLSADEQNKFMNEHPEEFKNL